jgi:hypothetical protein
VLGVQSVQHLAVNAHLGVAAGAGDIHVYGGAAGNRVVFQKHHLSAVAGGGDGRQAQLLVAESDFAGS